MNNSKLKSGFGIDDILYQNQNSSSRSPESPRVHSERRKEYPSTSSAISADYAKLTNHNMTEMYMDHQPKKPLPLFPPMVDFAKPSFCLPNLNGMQSPFSPSSYLEQYASALQKASPRLWPFYPHPYGGYLLPACNFKRKGGQVRFTPQQTTSLERRFSNHKYLSPEDRKHLALQLKLSDRQVKTWFQNRRAKWRRSNSSVTTSDPKPCNSYHHHIPPLNLQKSHKRACSLDEKQINVATSDRDSSSSDDEDNLEINLAENAN